MAFDFKPLEMDDFSGGITENVLQGDPRRYLSADNLVLTVDKNLIERQGFVPFSSTGTIIAAAPSQRINGLYAVRNEGELLAQVARSFYYLSSGAWTPIVGAAGGEALSGGDSNSQTTLSEFQKQIYITNDGANGANGCLPSKIYKDTTNTWTAKTAGLPRAFSTPNLTDGQLLSLCINNANALRTSMIAHMSDAGTAAFTYPNSVAPGQLHYNADFVALSYLQAQVYPTINVFGVTLPSPQPTPALAATDEASMYLLVQALNNAYTAHIADAMANAVSNVATTTLIFHQQFANPPDFPAFATPFTKGPGAPLNSPGTPKTHTIAATMLDDLWQKWNWHRKAVNTHDQQNNPGVFDKYAPVGAKIGTVYLTPSAPTITPNFQDILNYGNNLRFIYNYHVSGITGILGVGGHKQTTNFIYNLGLNCSLPECTDLDSFYLLIFWLRALYQLHNIDATGNGIYHPGQIYVNRQVTGTMTAGSTSLTGMTYVTGGAATDSSLQGQFISPLAVTPWNGAKAPDSSYNTSRIVFAVSGTATLDRPATTSGTFQAQCTFSHYHGDSTFSSVDSLVSLEQSIDTLSNPYLTLGLDLPTWLLLAQDLFFTMANHINFSPIHLFGAAKGYTTYVLPNTPYKNFFIPTYSTVAYAVFFSDSYVVEPNGIQYLTQGNPVFSAATVSAVSQPVGTVPTNLYPTYYTAAGTTALYGTTLSNLPVLVNDATTEYALSNVMLNIYRTTNGGTTYYLLAQVPNGTTTYLDTVSDNLANPGGTALTAGAPIYTSGGTVGYDQPPQCKYTHVLNGTVYWGAITDTGQYFPNRIRQSVPGNPDAAPATFFDDLDDALNGISSTHNNLLAFCKNSVYRMAGGFNGQGQGALTHQNISDTLGCLNAKSIVRTELGVFFAGNDGFYYTDGFQLINITLELKKIYATLTFSDSQKRSIYGAYDKLTRRVNWAMKQSPNDTDNSVLYTFYLDYGVKPSGTFTLIQNGSNFRPSSLVFQQGMMYYAHEKGYILKGDPNNKFDALVDTTKAPTAWINSVVPYNFTTVAVDLGTTFQRKWITKLHLVGQNLGNMAIQASVIRDVNQYGQNAMPLAAINYVGNITWNTPIIVWGDATQVWKTDGKMDVWRRFPQGSLRSDFVQIQLTPASLPVYASSAGYPFGANAVVDSVAKTATIQTPTGYTSIVWPGDVVGYSATFQIDGYVNQFKITAVDGTGKILTLADPSNLMVTNALGVPWQIMGVKKEQRFNLISMVIHFAYLGDKNQAYSGSTSDKGPGNLGGNPS